MSSKKFSPIALAVCSVLSFSTHAYEGPEFIGYINFGYIFTDSDQRNEGSGTLDKAVATEGGFGAFRVGNETNWYEAGLRDEIYNDGVTDVKAEWLLGNNTDDWSTVQTQALNVRMQGMFDSMPETTLWAGRRVDIKSEVYQIDLKLWYNHFYSVGLENLYLGNYNVDVALSFPDAINSVPKKEGGSTKVNPLLIDLRIKDVELFGVLPKTSFGLNYLFTHQKDIIADGDALSTSGALFTAENIHFWQYGFNTLTLQYGLDALASGLKDGMGVNEQPHYFGLPHQGNSLTAFYQGEVWPTDRFHIDWVLGYENLDLDNKLGKTWMGIALSPSYAWSDVHTTQFQFGYDQAEAQFFDRTNSTFKATIAQQIQPEVGKWARPIFRLALSYVEQSNQWTDTDWNYGDVQVPRALIGKQSSEILAGFTMEAWW